MAAAEDTPSTKETDRQSLRQYLQRAEVRLSTMHRIGGAFLSGAGLLILLPVFTKDTFLTLGSAFKTVWPALGAMACPIQPTPCPDILVIIFGLPVLTAFIIPLVALWLLLRDLSLFYFSANIPGDLETESRDFHPRFALTGIPFSNDEGADEKTRIREIQFNTNFRYFLIPQSRSHTTWLTRQIVTESGRSTALPETSMWLPQTKNSDSDAIRMAFGLAGAYDRDLVHEVAKSELSLIRHNLLLRRLVMRYMKALLSLIWTAIVSFILIAILNNILPREGGHANIDDQTLIIIIITSAFFIWSTLTPAIIRAPVKWIYSEYDQNIDDSTRDEHLVRFEVYVTVACIVVSLLGIVGLYQVLGHTSLYLLLFPISTAYILFRKRLSVASYHAGKD